MNINLIITMTSLLTSKVFIAIWIYKDSKSRGINPFIWAILVLFFSGSLAFLIYILVVRKESNIICEKCSFTQSDKLLYCGRCGSEIKLDKDDKFYNKNANRIFLNIGVFLLIIGIISGIIFTFKTVWKEKGSIPISIMSVSSKYNNKWKDKFKYKNGKFTHNFKVEEKTILDSSWNLKSGYINAKLYKDDKLIKDIDSRDNYNYEELVDLEEYKGSSVKLILTFEKASGQIEFILE